MPMAGEGKRFKDAGFKIHKPEILTFDRRSGKALPMVVCAALDLPEIEQEGENIIFIDRAFHVNEGVEHKILEYFPKAQFITTEVPTDGQACTCLLAKDNINKEEELLIAGCDNGMIYNLDKFKSEKKTCDCIVFTYRNNEAVLKNPNAYGWMKTDDNNYITDVSVKKAISDTPEKDHAVVATFYFRKGSIFVKAAEKMIAENDRINNEFYVDEVIKHVLEMGYIAKVFEIDRYLGWGTPYDHAVYMKTFQYWKEFLEDERCLYK